MKTTPGPHDSVIASEIQNSEIYMYIAICVMM